jgi:hypothetical protein
MKSMEIYCAGTCFNLGLRLNRILRQAAAQHLVDVNYLFALLLRLQHFLAPLFDPGQRSTWILLLQE